MLKFLPLNTIEKFIPEMKRRGVSEVARSPRGFLTAYRAVKGNRQRLGDDWIAKREAFIARHLVQLVGNDEPLYETGTLTRRHLALVAWAYSPDPEKVARLARQRP
jgi:hypothetical protein